MVQALKIVFALARKDWLRFSRQPFLIVISVVMPLVFVLFYAVIIPVSSTNPVVVAMESDGPAARQFLQILGDIHSQESAYYEIVTTAPVQARRMFDSGQAMGLVVIPPDFDGRLAEGNAQVELHINNIKSDYSKNLRLRLDYAVRKFNTQQIGPVVTINETTWLPHDPPMRDYVSTSLLLFACLYSTMVNTGLQVAAEWNDRTVKMLLLAPVNRMAIVTGKMVAGLGQSLVSIGLAALFLIFIFHFRPVGSWGAMVGVMAAVMLLGAGLGAAVGVASKQTLPTTTLLIAAAIIIFLVSGNEDSMRGLAWTGPIVGLWQLARILPTTYAFLAARSLFLTGDATTLFRDLTIVLAAAIGVVGGATVLMRRAYSQLPGGQ